MKTEFQNIFVRLREILKKHSGRLAVTDDAPRRYCLALAAHAHPRLKGPMPVAWVQIGKAYVSYYLMAVYGYPKLLDGCSKKLKTRMQGKSCFNFKVADEDLFKELEDLTVRGFEAFRKGTFGGMKPAEK
jgi:hypothetical protein